MSENRTPKRRLRGKGSVILISGLLLGSAALRVAIGAGEAVAQADLSEAFSLTPAVPKPANAAKDAETPQIEPLLDALRKREERAKQKEAELAMRAKALDVAQVEVERRLDALRQAEERLSETLTRAQTAAEDDIARLTTVYENMKPKDAAALFGAMEPEFAAGFLGRMRPDVAAKVMAGLDPQAAYSISAILAGRNARAPKS